LNIEIDTLPNYHARNVEHKTHPHYSRWFNVLRDSFGMDITPNLG